MKMRAAAKNILLPDKRWQSFRTNYNDIGHRFIQLIYILRFGLCKLCLELSP